MKILAFSDFHYCTTWPFLRLEDFEAAAHRICQYAIEHKPTVVLFLGDRFRARQPKDHIRALADRQLRELAGIQARHGGRVICLVGNHDRYSESVDSGNTYTTVGIFQDVLSNVSVVREPGTTEYQDGGAGWLLHALPTGYTYDATKLLFRPDPSRINVFVFHGLVRGAYFDAKGSVEIEKDAIISLADLDDSSWDVVLGGDVHIPQKFRLIRTVGGYVGATLRLTEADANDWRGFLDVDVEKGGTTITKVEGGAPWFATVQIACNPDDWPDPKPLVGAIAIVTIAGTAAELRAIPDARIRQHFEGARMVRVHRRFAHEAPAFIPAITAASTPLDDAVAYIKSSDRTGLDEARLIAKAMVALGAEPVRKGGLF